MRTFPLNSHPGHFSRVRQSKNFLISRTPCVSYRNNRIFSLRIVNSFLRLFFHTFRPRPHVSGYFWKRRFLCPLSKKNASLIFRPNWGPKGPKKIFGDRPPSLSQGLDDCAPPPRPAPYQTVWIHHWGPLHMSPVDRAGSVTGMNFALGSYEKF